MIRRLLALDGVEAICLFRDDGSVVESYGLIGFEEMERLARFAFHYRRLVQGTTDQYALFAGTRGWAPPRGWLLSAGRLTLCGVANLVCLAATDEVDSNQLLAEMLEIAHW